MLPMRSTATVRPRSRIQDDQQIAPGPVFLAQRQTTDAAAGERADAAEAFEPIGEATAVDAEIGCHAPALTASAVRPTIRR